MKVLFQLFILLIVWVVFADYCCCQDTTQQFSGSLIAGSKQWFLLSYDQEAPTKVQILSFTDDGVLIKNKQGKTRTIDRNKINSVTPIPYGSIGSVGFGFGVPYALLGINIDINPLPYLAISAGAGTTFFAGIGYNFGIRGYLRKPGPIWRPRVSLFYGINGVYAEDFGDPSNKKYTGITAGIGQIFLWDRHGFDLDLMYIVDSEIFDEHDTNGRIKISIGYRYAF